jgi:toxin FitB
VFDTWLLHLRRDDADRIVPIDRAIAEEWGRLNVPDPVPAADGLLAATAKVRDWTQVTRNVSNVARVLDPFAFAFAS